MDSKGQGQFLGLYKNPKLIGDSKIIKALPEHQAYLNAPEEQIKKIIVSKENVPLEERTSKQDPRFYNEKGIRDYDNSQGKW